MRNGSIALVIAVLTGVLTFTLLLRNEIEGVDMPSAYASVPRQDAGGRVYQNGNANANDNGSDDNTDRDNADNEDDDNDDFDNYDDDNDDFDFELPPYVPPGSSTTPQITAACSVAGRDTLFWSFDQRASLLISSATTRPMRVDILPVINAHEAPQPPGEFVDPHVYEVIVGFCDPVPVVTLPTESALTIHYSDAESIGKDESRFVIGRLDMSTGRWTAVGQNTSDPGANTISTMISESGYYMVWVER